MGLLDFGAQVVTRYRADTSQAKAELKSLQGEEKKLAEARLKAQESANKAAEASAKNWQFAAGAVGAVTAAIAIGKAGVEAYGRTSAKAASEVKELGDKFEKSFDKAMAGIGAAVMQFEPLLSAIATVGDKLVDLGEKGAWLAKKLGWITGVGAGAMALNAYLSGDNKLGGAAAGLQKPPPDHWDTTSSDAKAFVAQIAQGLQSYGTDLGKQYAAQQAQQRQAWNEAHGIFDFSDAEGMNIGQLRSEAAAAAKARREAARALSDRQTKELTDALLERLIAEQEARSSYSDVPAGSLGQQAANGSSSAVDAAMSKFYGAAGEFNNRNAAAYGAFNAGKEQTFLESHFGPLSDFDAYATAFNTLSGATSAALGAWIDGSESAGKAFKHFVGDALKALAQQMAVESLKHAAYALGSLAFGDLRGAGQHAAAAAAFGVGAAAAAVAAKSVGTSASDKASSSAGSGANPPSAPSSSNDRPQQQQTIIVYGDEFANSSPRSREEQAKRILDAGQGNAAWSYS